MVLNCFKHKSISTARLGFIKACVRGAIIGMMATRVTPNSTNADGDINGVIADAKNPLAHIVNKAA